ncbi:DUF2384 domain-containing protein (plasmid) [Rhodococcus sp. DMU1]|nr:DUF2384 domain-containing protein [Rhodococcus sp. DMU1]
METHEVVKYLLDRLGRTLTAYIAGSRSRAMPYRWATPPGQAHHARPADEKVRRLKAAHTVFTALEKAENDQVARSWLITANPRLGGHSPAEWIREDRIPEVFTAVTAFLEGTYYA